MVFEGGPDRIRLGEVKHVPAVFMTGDDEILVVRTGGAWVGVSNVCTHKMGPLNDGGLCSSVVECPWHGFQFDLRSGRCLSGRAKSLRWYVISFDSQGIAYAREVLDAGS